ncbi:ROK family protein [Methanobrevibacter sp.]|uniref:ROK family protein n=1 Tax=Methanobrevibacter sp. TaxID=66852 RepID=UPI0026DF2502|nr:ROK family protein [Methanobrevibacter sp.]MDO5859706.1 ROK family protein [Methanobrevibacter sp.]
MRNYAFSIDLGGTSTNFSVFISDEIISEWWVPTPKDNILEMLENEIKNEIAKLKLKSTDFKAIVIGIAGIVKEGIVEKAINLNLSGCDFGGLLQSRVNIKVIVLNDVNLQALGESKDYTSLFLVTIGTGIGAALIVNGHIVEGHNGAAGEIGHIYLDSKTPEENASAVGLVQTAKNYLKSNNDYSSLRDLETFTAKDIFEQARIGDEVALKIIHEIYFKFGKLLAVICSAFDPEVIIISGGVSNAGDLLLDTINEGFMEVAFKDSEICISEMKEKAAVYGAMRIVDDLYWEI